MLTVILSTNQKKQFQHYLFKFIAERRVDLFVLGINILVPAVGSTEQRFAFLLGQMKNLSPDQLTVFNLLKDKFFVELKAKDIKEGLLAEEEDRKDKLRQEQMAKLNKERSNNLKTINLDGPIDDMPDCDAKYRKILADCKENEKKFTDSQFSW